MARMEFGYHPPPGDRGIEIIRERDYLSDFKKAMDVAAQSFKSVWISDHLAYSDEFRLECWTHLTWVAAQYPNVDLGTIVMCSSWRQPVADGEDGGQPSLDERWSIDPRVRRRLVRGRVPLLRIRFPVAAHPRRDGRRGHPDHQGDVGPGPVTFEGQYYKVENAYCEPRFEKPPILMLGMSGERRAMRVVAKYADWWNTGARPIDELRHKLDVLRQHCEAEGRDFSTLRKTLNVRVAIAKSHKEALAMVERRSRPGSHPIAGDPVAVREQLAELADLGFDFSVLTFVNFQELDDIKLFADQVIPHFA